MSKRGWIIGLILALPAVAAQRFSNAPFYGFGGGGFGGGLYGLDLYGLYPGVIDFLVFFMIFTGLARAVFNKWFEDKQGAKALYVGLGLALSLGGTYYGYLSLEYFGNLAFPFFVIIGIAAMFGVLRLFGMNKFLAFITALVAVLFSAPIFSGIGSAAYGANFLKYIPSLFYGRWTLLGIVILILAGWIFHHIRKGYIYGGSSSGQGLPTAPSSGPGFFSRFRRKPKPENVASRGRERKAAKQFKKSYISFQEGQFNLLADLGNALNVWTSEYMEEEKTGQGIDPTSGERDSDKKRDHILRVLKQIRANTRYQRRRLRWARKQADQLDNRDVNSLINKLEKDESDFMLYVSKMLSIASNKSTRPQDFANYYTSLRSLAIEVRQLYSQLDNELHE